MTRAAAAPVFTVVLAALAVVLAANAPAPTTARAATVPKVKLGKRIGRLEDQDISRLNQAILIFLGLTVSPREKQMP